LAHVDTPLGIVAVLGFSYDIPAGW